MKTKLIKKLTSILAAGFISASTISFSACTNTDNLVSNLAADAKVNIKSCKFVFAENSKESNYISFLGHY